LHRRRVRVHGDRQGRRRPSDSDLPPDGRQDARRRRRLRRRRSHDLSGRPVRADGHRNEDRLPERDADRRVQGRRVGLRQRNAPLPGRDSLLRLPRTAHSRTTRTATACRTTAASADARAATRSPAGTWATSRSPASQAFSSVSAEHGRHARATSSRRPAIARARSTTTARALLIRTSSPAIARELSDRPDPGLRRGRDAGALRRGNPHVPGQRGQAVGCLRGVYGAESAGERLQQLRGQQLRRRRRRARGGLRHALPRHGRQPRRRGPAFRPEDVGLPGQLPVSVQKCGVYRGASACSLAAWTAMIRGAAPKAPNRDYWLAGKHRLRRATARGLGCVGRPWERGPPAARP